MKYQIFFPVESLANINRLSERVLSSKARLSRACIRSIRAKDSNVTINSICSLSDFFERQVEIIVSPQGSVSDFSTIASAYKVQRDGFNSWKIHFMNFIDEFRRSLDPRLIILPPSQDFDIKLRALLASLVSYLCQEANLATPAWAAKKYFLQSPWFVSGVESLKATAILESPLAFRGNNIFVQQNFANRA